MRDFKFKIWDKYNNRFLAYHQIGSATHPIKDTDSSISLGHSHDFIILQFTGLYDNQGKEICESDILLFVDPEDGYKEYHEVLYRAGSFVTRCNSYELLHDGYDAVDKDDDWMKTVEYFEIVGNIFQNKELLNK